MSKLIGFFSKLIFLLCLITSIGFAESSTTDSSANQLQTIKLNLQKFYQQASYRQFIADTMMALRYLPADSKEKLVVFSTLAIAAHPEFVPIIVKNFRSYPLEEKLLLYRALLASQQDSAVANITKMGTFLKKTTKTYSVEEIKQLAVDDQAKNLDLIWTAYFATGDNLYITKLLQFINNDQYLLSTSYELLAHQYNCEVIAKSNSKACAENKLKEILNKIANHYPDQAKIMQTRALLVSATLWSLEANRKQDDMLNDKMKQIFIKEPDLDYNINLKKTNQPVT